jgi:adenine-specific DNA-methyltransferase
LREDGVIFISIDDNEQANLKLLCDEIFGAENFVTQFLWKKKSTTSNVKDAQVSPQVDYQVCYKKSDNAKIKQRVKFSESRSYPESDEIGNYRTEVIEKKDSGSYKRDTMKFEILGHSPREGKRWQIGEKTARELEQRNRFYFDGEKIKLKIYDFEDENTYSAQPNVLENCGNSESAAELVNSVIFNHPELFDNPKPFELVKHFLNITVDAENDIILDFFAGSGTTAHAVLDLNEQDGGNRQFICVQMPEVLDETSEAYKAGYRTIADICKTRITKVVEKIQTERDSQKQSDLIPAESKQILGFKSFKLAPSNFKQWRSDVDEADILAQLELFKDSEQPHSENDAMLVELLLKAGLPLTTKVETHTVAEQTIYSIESGKLLFFFDDYTANVKDFIFTRKPKRVVCLNRVFKNDDQALTNFQLGLKDAGCELQII